MLVYGRIPTNLIKPLSMWLRKPKCHLVHWCDDETWEAYCGMYKHLRMRIHVVSVDPSCKNVICNGKLPDISAKEVCQNCLRSYNS